MNAEPFKIVTAYQTLDGKRFDTKAQAYKHIEAHIKDTFKKALMLGGCSNIDAIKLTEALYDNRRDIFSALNFEEYDFN
jgi:hypothetical protein